MQQSDKKAGTSPIPIYIGEVPAFLGHYAHRAKRNCKYRTRGGDAIPRIHLASIHYQSRLVLIRDLPDQVRQGSRQGTRTASESGAYDVETVAPLGR